MTICLYSEQFLRTFSTIKFSVPRHKIYTTVENYQRDLFSEILSREKTLHAEINGYYQGMFACLPIHWHI